MIIEINFCFKTLGYAQNKGTADLLVFLEDGNWRSARY
jgi:hypothetical protein